jgi:hypothetical protein
VHVHIPKTAGTALAEAFRQAYGDRIRVYPARFEAEFGQTPYAGFNFFTGHIGFTVACEIGGDLITVLRDPVDRFLSTYYFLRQLFNSGTERSHKASLAARFDLDQFARIRDEPVLEDELHNRMTWQLAHSHRVARRRELNVGDAELVRIAIENLSKFAIVGSQTDMAGLAEAIRRKYNVGLSIGRVNVTEQLWAREDIPSATMDRIAWWVHLDQELYREWTNRDTVSASRTRPIG